MHVVSDSERERFQKICEQKIKQVQGVGHECSRSSFVRSVDVFRWIRDFAITSLVVMKIDQNLEKVLAVDV